MLTSDWTRYYDAAGNAPRETLLQALSGFSEPGEAIDLGCGTGRDTVELLRRDWRVLAIDSHEEAIRRLRASVGLHDRLETRVAAFEDAVLPSSDLVNASYSLPFCRPELFDDFWERLVAALRGGGRFCGQLFGDRDEWAPADDITFFTRDAAEALLQPFEVERFDEVEEDSTTVVGDPKHWHVFHVVARKP
jgi:tellurite methyltransferase